MTNGPDTPSLDGPDWLAELRCPSCQGELNLVRVPVPMDGRGVWGTLTCWCSTYPVIDDIPVLLTDRVPSNSTGAPHVLDDGPTIDELIDLIRGPDPMQALARLVLLSPVPWPASKLPGVRQALAGSRQSNLEAAAGRRRFLRMCRRRDELTAEQWFAAMYLYGGDRGDNYSYFTYRFSEPRHLSFLALFAAMPEGTVLDVGCGAGHNCWHLSKAGRRVLGVDYNFAQVWVARWWVAPDARFVCADATRGLPLRDEFAAASLFADGIHYLPQPEPVLAEMRRCTTGGVLFLPRFGNRDVPPLDGIERSVAGWRDALAGLGSVRLLAESSLVATYLAGQGADLTRDDDEAVLRASKWLCAVASDDDVIFRDHGRLTDPPPHALGRLGINPIYVPVGRDGRTFRVVLPSDWYAFEDGELLRHHALQVRLTPEQFAMVQQGTFVPDLRDLVDEFVVIALPDRYLRDLNRRLKPRVEAILSTAVPRLARVPESAALPPRHRERRTPD